MAKKDKEAKPVASSDDKKEKKNKKRPRKRIARGFDKAPNKGPVDQGKFKQKHRKRPQKPQKVEPSEKEIQEQIKATLAKLSESKVKGSGVSRSKLRWAIHCDD